MVTFAPAALQAIDHYAEQMEQCSMALDEAAKVLMEREMRRFPILRERRVRQYVVLGAGLDTFAYRNPYPGSRLRVFEVDHPATQVWKRARLQEAGIAIPESLRFAAIDFETQTLSDGLRQAGFKADEPVFVSMLGVIVYLTRDAATSTLKFVSSLPPNTEIVFDYAISPSALSESDRRVHDDTIRVVAVRGEPWLSHFAPAALAADLQRPGSPASRISGPTRSRSATSRAGRTAFASMALRGW